MATRTDIIKRGSYFLAKNGIANHLGESETFLSHLLGTSRTNLYLDNLAVQDDASRQFFHLLTARAKGSPLQYLIGSTEFMGLEFKVRPGVFIPRPETELLVETVLELLSITSHSSPTILDIGTGCGNIAISIAKNIRKKTIHIFACDICDFALKLAKENALLNNVEIHVVKSNLLAGFKKNRQFSLIISNPPYISTEHISHLPRELCYEPTLAYNGGEQGLFYCRRIIEESLDYLQDTGFLILEIGDNQAEQVKELFACKQKRKKKKRFVNISAVKDYNEIERIIIAQLVSVK